MKRDSPAMPETRANGSPDGEVSRLRDFPKGNIDERAPSLPLVFKDFCPPALRPASSLISPAPSCGPPSHVPVATGSFGGSPLPFREDPKFLSAAFNTFRDLPPQHSFPLAPGTHLELPTASPTVPLHLASTLLHEFLQPPERSTLRGGLTASYSVVKIQFACHLLWQAPTPPKSMSHSFLWGPSLHQGTLLGVLSRTFAATGRQGPCASWLPPNHAGGEPVPDTQWRLKTLVTRAAT